jgi:hypothetical protein
MGLGVRSSPKGIAYDQVHDSIYAANSSNGLDILWKVNYFRSMSGNVCSYFRVAVLYPV